MYVFPFFFLIPLLLIRNLCYFAHGLFAETYFECTEVLAVLLKQSIFDGAVSMSHHLAPQKAKQKPVYHGSRIPKILSVILSVCMKDDRSYALSLLVYFFIILFQQLVRCMPQL